MRYQVYWTPQTQLKELQGADIDFQAFNQVSFTHRFLPSGHVIAVWHSKANYLRDKRVADLPSLKPGQSYLIRRDSENSERMHAYLAVTFLDQEGQVISTQHKNSEEIEVTAPSNMDSYRISLLSAGSGSFIFHSVTIQPLLQEEGDLLAGDESLENQVNLYLDHPEKVTSKTLRVIFSEPELHRTHYVNDVVTPSQQAVLYIATDLLHAQAYLDDDLDEKIQEAKKEVKAREIEFVGYGLVSSYAALKWQERTKNSAAIISDPAIDQAVAYADLMPADLAEFLKAIPAWVAQHTSQDQAFLASPFTTHYQVRLKVPHPNEDRLTTLTYEDLPLPKKDFAPQVETAPVQEEVSTAESQAPEKQPSKRAQKKAAKAQAAAQKAEEKAAQQEAAHQAQQEQANADKPEYKRSDRSQRLNNFFTQK